ncbi:hypothetical protein [Persicitalea jodogahamensis]|uniref:DUF4177 domain-containing protein n=1 Tax=Persicitalea jodogahamensis TaxID=402147 RepID=A0A8J3D6J4_9BACT|nr:hypothetical protein [Persicitalea jodogahamensis]GHB81444.1 hypothetical protein GCM10007390_40400 [Persicitalea jodogahamensis]
MSSYASAQVIMGDVNINDMPEVKICRLVATVKLFSSEVTAIIDYGQEIKQGGKSALLLDAATGKRREFKSLVDAINYMEANGWEFIDSFATTVSNQNLYHYHFRRKEGGK